MTERLEKGAASCYISLRNGMLKVIHGTDGHTLVEREMKEGEWTKLFDLLREGVV